MFQTLLDEKGIPSTLLDNGSNAIDRNNNATIAINVPDEHVAHALAVHADYSKGNKARADATEHTHPNKGYPFFSVWALITVALMLFFAGMCLPSIRADADADTWLVFFGCMFLTGITFGLGMAALIAFLRMIPSVFKRKIGEQREE